MNRAAVIIASLLAFGAGTWSLGDQAQTSVIDPGGTPRQESKTGNLIDLWTQRHALLERGDILAADEVVAEMQLQRRLSGVSRSEDLAGAFVLEGYENLAMQQYGEARAAFNLALEFDAEMPQAWFGLARTQWHTDEGAKGSLEALAGGVRAAGRNWIYRTNFLLAILWTFSLGLVTTAIAFLVILFFKTFRLIHHDLAEALMCRLPPITARTLAVFLPLLPLALPWGFAWAPLLWLALMLPFLSRGERGASVALVVAAATVGFMVPMAATFTAETADPRLVQVAGAAGGGVGADRYRTLAELAARSPDDAVLHLLLADQARGMGRDAEAISAYQRATELDPSLSYAYNNAGALYFSRGRFATAAGQFRKAIDADQDHMVARYNLYLTQEHRFDFTAAEKTLAEAQNHNLAAMTALLSDRRQGNERLDVLEDQIPVSVALAHARQALGQDGGTHVAGFAASTWPALALPVAAFGLGFWRLRRKNYPVRCSSCGRIACQRCSLNLEGDSRCATCVVLATRTTALPRRSRDQKRREIANYRRKFLRTCRLLSAIFPGGGQIWSGRPLLGATLLTMASCGLVAALFYKLLPVATYTPVSSGPHLVLTAGLSCLSLAWLLGWLLPSRRGATSRTGKG